jgi:predicted enzyme related to lactoylglutathione lyase
VDLGCVTIDARDPARLAAFWSEALGWQVAPTGEEGVVNVVAEGGGVHLELVRVDDEKVVKNRVHVGCSAGSFDELDAEVERLLGLGASVAWEEEFPPEVAAVYRNVVLQDPEGNEFCLSGEAR